jgi:hypothetical protein
MAGTSKTFLPGDVVGVRAGKNSEPIRKILLWKMKIIVLPPRQIVAIPDKTRNAIRDQMRGTMDIT